MVPPPALDQVIWNNINSAGNDLAAEINADVVAFMGTIHYAVLKPFRNTIEDLAQNRPRKGRTVAVILKTPGGLVHIAEIMSNILRYHYEFVYFIVPDAAMSAGTILCMSGNKIYMDYSSSLGPIDPQVQSSGQKMVPALAYLDMFERFIEKARLGILTTAEFALLEKQDLAELRWYEQARDLSVEVLKEFLVKYKFSSWEKHRTTEEIKGNPVTDDEKRDRAKEIADALGDHKKWHSHGRPIGIEVLTKDLRLEIENYSSNIQLRSKIRQYHDLLTEYMDRMGIQFLSHAPVHS